MATMNEIINSVFSTYPESSMARTKSMGNFIAVKGEIVEGIQTYYAVKVSATLYKPTATNSAFDIDTAHAEYLDFVARQEEKVNKPKATKTADPVKTAAKIARQNKLLEFLKNNAGVEFTSSTIKENLPDVYGDHFVMTVGTDLSAIAAVDENLTHRTDEKHKKHWTYIG